MKRLLLVIIVCGLAGTSRAFAQDSLKTKDFLYRRMEKYTRGLSNKYQPNKTVPQKPKEPVAPKGNKPLKSYNVPAATTGNKLALSVANSMDRSLEGITVQITHLPDWMTVERNK